MAVATVHVTRKLTPTGPNESIVSAICVHLLLSITLFSCAPSAAGGEGGLAWGWDGMGDGLVLAFVDRWVKVDCRSS